MNTLNNEYNNNEIQNLHTMIHFDLPKEKSSILKVIGIGGGGSNAVNHMFNQHIEGVNFIICNTDAQAIAQSNVPNKIQLGPHLTQGLGAGANPEIGKQATEESLEEITRILEVNTKMAFITAGMGGGTGTGGAPIISKICKDLGILTVGIVTTPFAYEGKKRQLQAEEGIEKLKEYVDTLLVISNDKMRHQYGNLKMKDAFAKADNVLATAAKCITDVINSTGQINVDFADVCTVMRNGGVAILGSAVCEGDNRAQKAIEEALNSPLLNDNDIRGAKWILININSSEGDHEFTMDEVDVIQNYLLSHAGEDTDVIMGLGYDSSLDRKIGITLIATGFEHKSPFYKKDIVKPEPKKEEKIVMTLSTPEDDKNVFRNSAVAGKAETPEVKPAPVVKPEDPLMPTMVQNDPVVTYMDEVPKKEEPVEKFELDYTQPGNMQAEPMEKYSLHQASVPEPYKSFEMVNDQEKAVQAAREKMALHEKSTGHGSIVSGGYLAKPFNIYAEPQPEQGAGLRQPAPMQQAKKETEQQVSFEEDPGFDMQLVIREDIRPTASASPSPDDAKPQPKNQPPANDLPISDETEEQRRRASERIQKLRNLSYNINGADSNNEFETVPAYIRRNLDLYNTANNVENFYSSYTVQPDDKNKAHISTKNTFLDGTKPD
jgi:cell division protein FtsZ